MLLIEINYLFIFWGGLLGSNINEEGTSTNIDTEYGIWNMAWDEKVFSVFYGWVDLPLPFVGVSINKAKVIPIRI